MSITTYVDEVEVVSEFTEVVQGGRHRVGVNSRDVAALAFAVSCVGLGLDALLGVAALMVQATSNRQVRRTSGGGVKILLHLSFC